VEHSPKNVQLENVKFPKRSTLAVFKTTLVSFQTPTMRGVVHADQDDVQGRVL
jgi:hypothetical protein